jgi:DHA1 family tetracycline resistance protein-like MFS transporter
MRSQTRRILIPYAIVILFAYIGFSLPLPIFPEMFLDPERSILPGVSLQHKMILLGLVMASFPLGQFFGSPFLGRLSDRYGRKKIVLGSLAGTTAGFLVTAFAVHAHSIWGMFCGLALCGFCEGNVTIAQSVIADLTGKESHEKATHFGWINIFISVGFIIGPLMGGVLADPTVVRWFTFSTPFWVAACMTVRGLGIIYFYSEETLKQKSGDRWKFFNAMWSGLRRPKLKGFYLANFFLALGYFSFFRFFPVFLERQFGFTASQLSYVMVYDSFAIMAGVIWLIPFLSKRFKPVESLCLFSFLLCVTSIVCLLPKSPYWLLVTLPPLGICLAVVITNGALLISNTASQEFQGQALGTLTSVQVLAEIFTGLAGGPMAAFAMTLPLYIGGTMAVFCGLILYISIRRENALKRG